MDPKELEAKVKELCVAKLSEMIECFGQGVYYKKCKLTHIAEMVKLVHQIRSLG